MELTNVVNGFIGSSEDTITTIYMIKITDKTIGIISSNIDLRNLEFNLKIKLN